jgi:carboxyl-terminal processing protease
LTTASYWRPSGKNIHRFPDSKETDEWGVKPDPGFEVKLTALERKALLDHLQRQAIIPRRDRIEKQMEPEFRDRQLEKALDHFRKKS